MEGGGHVGMRAWTVPPPGQGSFDVSHTGLVSSTLLRRYDLLGHDSEMFKNNRPLSSRIPARYPVEPPSISVTSGNNSWTIQSTFPLLFQSLIRQEAQRNIPTYFTTTKHQHGWCANRYKRWGVSVSPQRHQRKNKPRSAYAIHLQRQDVLGARQTQNGR